MKGSKLYIGLTLLKSLNSDDELNRFYAYVIYVAKSQKNIVEFAQYLSKKKITELTDLSDSTICKELNTNKVADRKSKLFNHLEEYLTIIQLNKSKPYQHILLNRFYEKENSKLYDQHFKRTKKSKDNFYSDEDYLALYFLEITNVSYDKKVKGRKNTESFEESIAHLDSFYFSTALKLECEKLNRNYTLGTNLEVGLVKKQIDAYYKELVSPNIVLVYFYYYLYEMLATNKESSFFEVLDSIESVLKLSKEDEKTIIIDYLLNYCIRRINENKNKYAGIYLGLIKRKEDNKLLYSMSAGQYKAIISAGIKADLEHNQLISLLNNYNKYLKCASRDLEKMYYNFNLALIEFENNDIDNVQKILSTLNFEDVYYKLGVKKLTIKAIYVGQEENWLNILLAQIRNYNDFLRKHERKIKPHYKKLKNFSTTLKKIVKLNSMEDEKIQEQIKSIEESTDLVDKHWLLKIIKGMK